MKKVSAILGIVSALGGTISGLLNWYLALFYLPEVNWEGPAETLNNALWLFSVLGLGLGILLIGVASLINVSDKA